MGSAWVRAISCCCVVTAVAGGGCGPAAVDDGSGTGAATSGSSGPAGSTTRDDVSASSTVADGSTSDVATGDAVTTSDATTSDTTGVDSSTDTGERCAEPEMVSVAFTVSPDESISTTCSVLTVGGDPEQHVLTLDCEGQAVTLTLAIAPQLATPAVNEGQQVRLEYVMDPIFWVNRWLAVHSADGESDWLLLGAVESSTLDPPGTTIDAFFGGSLGAPTVTAVPGLCMPIDDDCGPLERIALELAIDGAGVQVLDQATGIIDVLAFGYAITVARAVVYPKPQACDDVPPAWFHFAMLWFASD